MKMLENGGWKSMLTGATIVGALALGWNIYHTTTSDSIAYGKQTISDASADAIWRALVTKHIEETDPLKADYLQTRQQTVLNTQAITAIQTGMGSMQEDLRAIRDYIYGRRPREPQR